MRYIRTLSGLRVGFTLVVDDFYTPLNCREILKTEQRLNSLIKLGERLDQESKKIDELGEAASHRNMWFTPDNVKKSLHAISTEFLDEEKLSTWSSGYDLDRKTPRKIGLVLAGNIPLVGWHDVMCSFVAGHHAVIKYSSKDDLLIPALIDMLAEINPQTTKYFSKVELLKDIDAVIATGGETASTHFNYYFAKYPHIIRKNRSSCAVLDGQESNEELEALSDDIFEYFGLGCRSVSKIFVPEGYDPGPFFEACMKHADVIHHNKYKNNYDYTNALYLLAQLPFLTNNFLILKDDPGLSSRISCVHKSEYQTWDEVKRQLTDAQDQLQCIASRQDIPGYQVTPLGECQRPSLSDYADGVDTMTFLTELSHD